MVCGNVYTCRAADERQDRGWLIFFDILHKRVALVPPSGPSDVAVSPHAQASPLITTDYRQLWAPMDNFGRSWVSAPPWGVFSTKGLGFCPIMGPSQRPGEFGRLSATMGDYGFWDTHRLWFRIFPTMDDQRPKNGSGHRGLPAPSSGTTGMGAPS